MRSLGITLVGVGGEDVFNVNRDLVLALLFAIILYATKNDFRLDDADEGLEAAIAETKRLEAAATALDPGSDGFREAAEAARAFAAGQLQAKVEAALAAACDGASGRALRKLPFLAHASHAPQTDAPMSVESYLAALHATALEEREARSQQEHRG